MSTPDRVWAGDRVRVLHEYVGEGFSSREIGHRMGTSRGAVLVKASRIGLRIANTRLWNREKTNTFVALVGKGFSPSEVSVRMSISRNAALGKAHRMGLRFGGSSPVTTSKVTLPRLSIQRSTFHHEHA